MRVSLIILSKRFGGAERHVLDLANQLTCRDILVQLIARQAGWLNESIAKTLAPDIQIDWIGGVFKRRALRRAIRNFGPDVIHSHLGMSSRLTGQLGLGIPAVATLHGRFKAKDHMRHDALICVAPWQTSTIAPTYSGQVEIIPNFLDPKPLQPEERIRTRQGYAFDDDTLVIGSVGRFSKEKGFDTLIHAFQEAAIPNSRLLLVGDGPEMGALRTLATEHVIFAGWQNDPSHHYAAFDVFASTARSESFGLAILQAMQNGLPILATRTDGPGWLLREDGGITVPIDDVGAISSAMRKLACDPILRSELGKRALGHSLEFQPEYVVPTLLTVYQNLCITSG